MLFWKKKGLNRLPLSKTVRVFAPAKVNLSLHVTGQRSDGYHLLDSLVVFAGVGDFVSATQGDGGLTVTGPKAKGVPTDDGNLVMKAAQLMGLSDGHSLSLEKHLPAASGIGGGSADAAAALRALHSVSGKQLPELKQVLSLGADVPVCLEAQPVRMRGVGEQLEPVPTLPDLWIVLINPGLEVATPDVFARLTTKTHPGMGARLPEWRSSSEFLSWLEGQRNDLQSPAIAVAPVIAACLKALRATQGCELARMSGSGATCFGLFESAQAAQKAAREIQADQPNWWCANAPILSGIN